MVKTKTLNHKSQTHTNKLNSKWKILEMFRILNLFGVWSLNIGAYNLVLKKGDLKCVD